MIFLFALCYLQSNYNSFQLYFQIEVCHLKIGLFISDRRNEVDFILQKETVTSVIDTVTNVFYYDHQGFIDKEKFESMMKPILDQVIVFK